MINILDFLIDKKVLGEFKKEYMEQIEGKDANKYLLRYSHHEDAIMAAFVFNESSRGFKFWADINIEWFENVNGGKR